MVTSAAVFHWNIRHQTVDETHMVCYNILTPKTLGKEKVLREKRFKL